MEIQGKTIIITGASEGLGRSMAMMFARKGAQLALVDIAEDRLKDISDQCRDAGADARAYLADVTDEAAVEQAFNDVVRDFGGIDGLINNAGTNADALLVKKGNGEIHKMPLEDFDKVVAVDLRGVFLCGREAAAHMVRRDQGGVIINISSIARAGNIGQSNYAAAKAGIVAMTVSWAQELAKFGMRVAAIAPGFSDTQMVARMKPALQDKFRQRIPLHRFAMPEEIAHSALFILENEYFNGRTLEVDGGLRL